jgi:hypothetical protein
MLSRTNYSRGLMMPSTNGHGPKRAIPFIWAEVFFGIGWGIVAGLVVGGGAGLLANAVLSKILYWLMPDLRALLRHN